MKQPKPRNNSSYSNGQTRQDKNTQAPKSMFSGVFVFPIVILSQFRVQGKGYKAGWSNVVSRSD